MSYYRLRIVVSLALVFAPLVCLTICTVLFANGPAFAQQVSGKPTRVAWASLNSLEQVKSLLDAFRAGLAAHGLKEGQNLELMVRSADGVRDRMASVMEELVALDILTAPVRNAPALEQAIAEFGENRTAAF
jgi:hypothetical protein